LYVGGNVRKAVVHRVPEIPREYTLSWAGTKFVEIDEGLNGLGGTIPGPETEERVK
jgi:hypothetical protein